MPVSVSARPKRSIVSARPSPSASRSATIPGGASRPGRRSPRPLRSTTYTSPAPLTARCRGRSSPSANIVARKPGGRTRPAVAAAAGSASSEPPPQPASSASATAEASRRAFIRGPSDVEAEVDDVAFAHHVVLPLDPELPGLARTLLAAARDELLVADHLRANEAALEVRVD